MNCVRHPQDTALDLMCIMVTLMLRSMFDTLEVSPELTVTSQVVLGMLAQTGTLCQGHQINMDNYYTSPELFEELNALDTYACGTVRVNRKEVPVDIKQKKKLRQGEGIFRRRGNLLALKYHDKRDIHMLTSIHQAQIALTDKHDKEGVPITKPVAIMDYIKKMGGVDLSDQSLQYYDVLRKSVKWWKKIFFHLFNLMVVNSYKLYLKFTNEQKTKSHRLQNSFS